MRRQITATFAAMLAVAPALAATPSALNRMTLHPASRLWVEGTSTVRSFSCKALTLDADVQAAPGAATLVAAGEKGVQSVAIAIPAEALDCGNGTMNEHMRKAIKAKDNPTITFRLASYDLAKAGASTTVSIAGTLALGGTEKPVTITANATQEDTGTLHVVGAYDVRMSEFGLKPPSLMMGTMKVGDVVKVRFDLSLRD